MDATLSIAAGGTGWERWKPTMHLRSAAVNDDGNFALLVVQQAWQDQASGAIEWRNLDHVRNPEKIEGRDAYR